jgi:hypothetical protein
VNTEVPYYGFCSEWTERADVEFEGGPQSAEIRQLPIELPELAEPMQADLYTEQDLGLRAEETRGEKRER